MRWKRWALGLGLIGAIAFTIVKTDIIKGLENIVAGISISDSSYTPPELRELNIDKYCLDDMVKHGYKPEHVPGIKRLVKEGCSKYEIRTLYEIGVMPDSKLAYAYTDLKPHCSYLSVTFDELLQNGFKPEHLPVVLQSLKNGLTFIDIENLYKKVNKFHVEPSADNISILFGAVEEANAQYKRKGESILPGENLIQVNKILLSHASANQVIFFGEVHGKQVDGKYQVVEEDNNYVITLLPRLKQLGYDYFAVEIDSHEQPLIDDYLSGRISKNNLEKKLKEISEYVNKTSNGENQYRLGSYLSLIEEAHKMGCKIVCYDQRPEGYVAPGDSTFSKSPGEREWKSLTNLRDMIFNSQPNAKVVVYGGSFHAMKYDTVNYDTLTLSCLLDAFTHKSCYSVVLRGFEFKETGFDMNLSSHPLLTENKKN